MRLHQMSQQQEEVSRSVRTMQISAWQKTKALRLEAEVSDMPPRSTLYLSHTLPYALCLTHSALYLAVPYTSHTQLPYKLP